MGAWGMGILDNDSAMDWVDAQEERVPSLEELAAAAVSAEWPEERLAAAAVLSMAIPAVRRTGAPRSLEDAALLVEMVCSATWDRMDPVDWPAVEGGVFRAIGLIRSDAAEVLGPNADGWREPSLRAAELEYLAATLAAVLPSA